MQDAAPTTQQFLAYWLHTGWLRQCCNHQLLPDALRPFMHLVAQADLKKGELPKRKRWLKEGPLWIAPFVGINDQKAWCVPVWLEVTITRQKKLHCATHTLPWIPEMLWETGVLTHTPQFEAALAQLGEPEQHTPDADSAARWEQLWSHTHTLLQESTQGTWRSMLAEAGFVLQKEGGVFAAQAFLEHMGVGEPLGRHEQGLLGRAHARIQGVAIGQAGLGATPASTHTVHAAHMSPTPLSPQTRAALQRVLTLPQNDWHVIESPYLKVSQEVFQAWACSTWVAHALSIDGTGPGQRVVLTTDPKRAQTLAFTPKADPKHPLHRWWGNNLSQARDQGTDPALWPAPATYQKNASEYFQIPWQSWDQVCTLLSDRLTQRLDQLKDWSQWLASTAQEPPEPGASKTTLASEQNVLLQRQHQQLIQAITAWPVFVRQKGLWWRRHLPFGRKGLRDQIFVFYERFLLGLLSWEEDAFQEGSALAPLLQHRLQRLMHERSQARSTLQKNTPNLQSTSNSWLEKLPERLKNSLAGHEANGHQQPEEVLDRSLREEAFWLGLHLKEAQWLRACEQHATQEANRSATPHDPKADPAQTTQASPTPPPQFEWPWDTRTLHEVSPNGTAMLWVDGAQDTSLSALMPWLLHTQQAVLCGDLTQSTGPSGSTLYQPWDAARYHLVHGDDDVDVIEQMGLGLSCPSALVLATLTGAFQHRDDFGITHPETSWVGDAHVQPGALASCLKHLGRYNPPLNMDPEGAIPSVSIVPLKTTRHDVHQGVNLQEAYGALHWLTQHADRSQWSVFTPCVHQAAWLKARLSLHAVHSPADFPHTTSKNTLLCLGTNTQHHRPFFLDAHPAFLQRVLAQTEEQLVVLGDMACCDPNTNAPMGQLGTLLRQAPVHPKAILAYTNQQGKLLPTFTINDREALQAFWVRLLERAQNSITLAADPISPERFFDVFGLIQTHEACQKGLALHLLTTHEALKPLKDSMPEALKRLHVATTRLLATNYIIVDDHELYELPESLLSNGAFPRQGVYWQAYANERIKNLKQSTYQEATREASRVVRQES